MIKKIRYCKTSQKPVLKKHWAKHPEIIEEIVDEIMELVDSGWSITYAQQCVGVITYYTYLQEAIKKNIRFQKFRSEYLKRVNKNKRNLSLLGTK